MWLSLWALVKTESRLGWGAKWSCDIWLKDTTSEWRSVFTVGVKRAFLYYVWHYWAYCTVSTAVLHGAGQMARLCPHTWHCRWRPAVLAVSARASDVRTVCLPIPSQLPTLKWSLQILNMSTWYVHDTMCLLQYADVYSLRTHAVSLSVWLKTQGGGNWGNSWLYIWIIIQLTIDSPL